MAEIFRFRRLRHSAPALMPSLATAAAVRRRRDRLATLGLAALAFVAGAFVFGVGLRLAPADLLAVSTAEAPAISRVFPLCNAGRGDTCIIDGDTFRLDGQPIRIADIDTPEARGFACPAEKVLADRATARLAELLNAGPFTLAAADRDEDRYGRKLRIAMRDGTSLGAILVAEGFAHRWDGRKHPWC